MTQSANQPLLGDKKRLLVFIPVITLLVFIVLTRTPDSTGQSVLDETLEDDVISFPQPAHATLPVPIPVEPVLAPPESLDDLVENDLLTVEAEIGRLAASSVIINQKATSQVAAAAMETPLGPVFDPSSGFAQAAVNAHAGTATATQQYDLAYKVIQGQRFSAVLTHAIHSDLPGMVVAELTQAVYGYQSNQVLLPAGTRLVGVYNSQTRVGDTRLYMIWQRAVTPDGVDIQLDSPSTDRLGQAGLTGLVDTHFWETFGTSSLLSVMAVGASNLSEGQGDESNQYQQGVTDALMDTSRSVLRSRIQRRPTIHIDQGEVIHVVVAKDLDFSPVRQTQHSVAIF